MKTLIIILISIIIILAAIFLPIYNGRVGGCGVVEGGGCWNYKLNLIEYIKYKNPPVDHSLRYFCDDVGVPSGQIGFTINKQDDGKWHLVIASKPPVADIVVNVNRISDSDYRYVGNGVDIADTISGVIGTLNGKILKNCQKLYPGI